jgi:hypothetical protein
MKLENKLGQILFLIPKLIYTQFRSGGVRRDRRA